MGVSALTTVAVYLSEAVGVDRGVNVGLVGVEVGVGRGVDVGLGVGVGLQLEHKNREIRSAVKNRTEMLRCFDNRSLPTFLLLGPYARSEKPTI